MAEGGGDQKASGAPTDAHDVFVSYASADNAAAERQ
jgi:hypothetical protein